METLNHSASFKAYSIRKQGFKSYVEDNAKIQIAKNMLNEGYLVVSISKCTGLSIREFNKL